MSIFSLLPVDLDPDAAEFGHLLLKQSQMRSFQALFHLFLCCCAGKKAAPRASGSETTAKAKPLSPPRPRLSFPSRKVAKSRQKTSASVSNSRSTCEATELPLRDRVIHLLVLRPYKRSELVLRLRRDGVTDGEGDGLEPVLQEVRGSPSGVCDPS